MSLAPSLSVTHINFDKHVLGLSVAFFVISSLVISGAPLLPFIDLPNHLAEATIFKFYNEPGNTLRSYYHPAPWFYPNTFHAIFCGAFPSVEAGNKVFHIFYIGLLQLALMLLIRRFDGNPWYGLLGLVFTYNYNLTFGFVGFAISIPVLLLLFYFILQSFTSARVVWKFLIAFTLLILYFMHAQNALLGLLFYGVLLLFHYRFNLRRAVMQGLPVSLPLVAVMAAWWSLKEDPAGESTIDFLLVYYRSEFWTEYGKRFYLPFLDNYSLYGGITGVVVAFLLTCMVAAPLIVFRTWTRSAATRLLHGENRYLLILFAASVACYFLLPERLPGQTPLYQRFSTIVLLAFVLIGSVLMRDVHTGSMKVFTAIVIGSTLFMWGEYIIAFNRENRDFNPSFLQLGNKDEKLMGLIWNNEFRGRKVYIHFPNYYIVWHKGIAGSKIIDYRFGIVRRGVPETVLPFYHEYALTEFVPMMRYESADYFLARESDRTLTATHFSEAEPIREAGRWVIYRNK